MSLKHALLYFYRTFVLLIFNMVNDNKQMIIETIVYPVDISHCDKTIIFTILIIKIKETIQDLKLQARSNEIKFI